MGAAKKQVMDVSKPGKSAASATARPLIVGHGVSVQDPMVVPAANSSPAPTSPDVSAPADDAEPLQARHGETVIAPLTQDESGQAEEVADPKEAADSSADNTGTAEADAETSDQDLDAAADTAVSDEATKHQPEKEGATPESTGDSVEVSEAASVDAVVSQASVKKQVQDEESKRLEHEAALQKLIDDKTYFVHIAKPHRRSGAATILFIIVLLLAVLASVYIAADAGVFGANFEVPYHLLPQ